jgi:selenocysteine lyase/cysteine desulfurase
MDHAYFLYHSIGLYPGKAADMGAALSAFAELWSAPDDSQWPRALAAREEYLALWRDLIGAPDGSLTSAENVTTGLFSVVGGIADRLHGRTVLVGADCFPSLHFLLAGLADRLGFTLRTVPLRLGEAWVREEDLIDAWGRDVALALLTFVTSTASYRCDLDALVAHGHDMGSLVAVDLTQGVGILPFSVAETPADIVVSTSLKWLCGTPGAGIVQMRPELLAETTPELRGWFSQPNPFSWDLDAFAYAPDARRLDHGTPSVLACVGSVPALRWHRAQQGGALLAQNRRLAARIMDEARSRGLALASPEDDARRGGSVMIRLAEGTDGPALIAGLREIGVHADCRGRILRLSPGVVTEKAGIARLFDGLDRFRAR